MFYLSIWYVLTSVTSSMLIVANLIVDITTPLSSIKLGFQYLRIWTILLVA